MGVFLAVAVRGTFVGPQVRITILYGLFYDVVCLWRYSDGKMAPRHENFSHAYQILFHNTLLKFTLVSENAIKKFPPWDPTLGKFLGGGGGWKTTLSEFTLVSENAIKKFAPWDPTLGIFFGGGGGWKATLLELTPVNVFVCMVYGLV